MSSSARASNVRIRELQQRDRPRWNELWAAYLAFYEQELAPEVTEHTWRRVLEPAKSSMGGFAALDEHDHLIGFTHYHIHQSTWSLSSYCYLEDLFVDPARRSRGTGRALIDAVFERADILGATRVYWHTEISNARAQILYHQVADLTPFVQFRRRK